MKLKLITNIRSTSKRSWIEHQLQVNEVMDWIAANLPDTVAFNDCAAFGTDEDYLLFKMKYSKTCDWHEKAYETVTYSDAATRAGHAYTAVSIAVDPAANAISPIVVTRV